MSSTGADGTIPTGYFPSPAPAPAPTCCQCTHSRNYRHDSGVGQQCGEQSLSRLCRPLEQPGGWFQPSALPQPPLQQANPRELPSPTQKLLGLQREPEPKLPPESLQQTQRQQGDPGPAVSGAVVAAEASLFSAASSQLTDSLAMQRSQSDGGGDDRSLQGAGKRLTLAQLQAGRPPLPSCAAASGRTAISASAAVSCTQPDPRLPVPDRPCRGLFPQRQFCHGLKAAAANLGICPTSASSHSRRS